MQVGQIIEVVRLRPNAKKEPFCVQIDEINIAGVQATPVYWTGAPPVVKIQFNRIGISTDGRFKVNENIKFTTG